jgi:hypothetical protein
MGTMKRQREKNMFDEIICDQCLEVTDKYCSDEGLFTCQECRDEIQRRGEKNGLYPDKWDDCN